MLFKQRFHAGIRDGSITRTYRAWKSARASAGRTHRLGPDDAIEVVAVERVALGSLTARDARAAGFDEKDELLDVLRASSSPRLTARSVVFRVDFRRVRAADPRTALRGDTRAGELDEVTQRLDRMDRLSRRGPWTREVLELIAARPRTVASELARGLGRETRTFKADVRKLKGLGLTVSHEVGYSLSPRGRALLRRKG